jgi:hypothetical protein
MDLFRTIDLPRSTTRQMQRALFQEQQGCTTGMPRIVKHAQRDPAASYRSGINPLKSCAMTITGALIK